MASNSLLSQASACLNDQIDVIDVSNSEMLNRLHLSNTNSPSMWNGVVLSWNIADGLVEPRRNALRGILPRGGADIMCFQESTWVPRTTIAHLQLPPDRYKAFGVEEYTNFYLTFLWNYEKLNFQQINPIQYQNIWDLANNQLWRNEAFSRMLVGQFTIIRLNINFLVFNLHFKQHQEQIFVTHTFNMIKDLSNHLHCPATIVGDINFNVFDETYLPQGVHYLALEDPQRPDGTIDGLWFYNPPQAKRELHLLDGELVSVQNLEGGANAEDVALPQQVPERLLNHPLLKAILQIT